MTNYYTFKNILNDKNGGIANISGTPVPWFTATKVSDQAKQIQYSADIYDNDSFEILFESECAFNILEGMEVDGNRTFMMYIIKTSDDKLLAWVTLDEFRPKDYEVIFEFEFVPAMIFVDSLPEVFDDICKPFRFGYSDHGEDYYHDNSTILDTLRAHSLMLLNKKHSGVANKFKELLVANIQF
jgi:hypothetical protein